MSLNPILRSNPGGFRAVGSTGNNRVTPPWERAEWAGSRIYVPEAVAPSGDATADGQTLSAVASLVTGAASASSQATGQTLTISASLIAGQGQASSSVSGQTLTTAATLIAGAASAASTADGQTLAVAASLIDGAATGDSGAVDATADGQTLTVTASLEAGSASAEEEAGPSGRVKRRGRFRVVKLGEDSARQALEELKASLPAAPEKPKSVIEAFAPGLLTGAAPPPVKVREVKPVFTGPTAEELEEEDVAALLLGAVPARPRLRSAEDDDEEAAILLLFT